MNIEYWEKCDLREYMGSPFADRSWGLVAVEIGSNEEATRIIMNDPFVSENLIEGKWIKEWVAE